MGPRDSTAPSGIGTGESLFLLRLPPLPPGSRARQPIDAETLRGFLGLGTRTMRKTDLLRLIDQAVAEAARREAVKIAFRRRISRRSPRRDLRPKRLTIVVRATQRRGPHARARRAAAPARLRSSSGSSDDPGGDSDGDGPEWPPRQGQGLPLAKTRRTRGMNTPVVYLCTRVETATP